jgi:hypothetical protein
MYAVAANSECTDTVEGAPHYVLPPYHPPYRVSHEGCDIGSGLPRHLGSVATVTPCQRRGQSSHPLNSITARQTHPEHRAKGVSQPISITLPEGGRHSWDADLLCMIRTWMSWPQTGRRGARILCTISTKSGAGVYVGYLLRHMPKDKNWGSTQN